MPWVTYDFTPGSLEEFISLGLPMEIPIEIPMLGIGTPKIPIGLGLQPFDAGITVNFTCPGWPACGRLEGACSYTISKGISMDPSKLMPTIPTIPAIPAFNLIIFPGYKTSIKVPPDIYNPLKCPNNPKKV